MGLRPDTICMRGMACAAGAHLERGTVHILVPLHEMHERRRLLAREQRTGAAEERWLDDGPQAGHQRRVRRPMRSTERRVLELRVRRHGVHERTGVRRHPGLQHRGFAAVHCLVLALQRRPVLRRHDHLPAGGAAAADLFHGTPQIDLRDRGSRFEDGLRRPNTPKDTATCLWRYCNIEGEKRWAAPRHNLQSLMRPRYALLHYFGTNTLCRTAPTAVDSAEMDWVAGASFAVALSVQAAVRRSVTSSECRFRKIGFE